MSASDWIALIGAVVVLLAQSFTFAVFITRVASKAEVNSKAIDELWKESSRCEGRLTALRTEIDRGFDAKAQRIDEAARQHNELASTVAAGFARMDATLIGFKESMDRLLQVRSPEIPTRIDPPTGLGVLKTILDTVHALKSLGLNISPAASGARP